MARVLCVLYPDPQAGYPPTYPRDDIPTITRYTNGQGAPTPKGPLGFKPGELVGCVSGELGLRSYLEKLGHELTAGIGSDHVDLKAAARARITVAEVTGSNSISVADCVARSYDVEGMHFGTIGAGRIGLAVLRRLKPFDLHLHYSDPHRLSPDIEKELNLTFHPDAESLVRAVDIIDVHMPLYPSTEHFFDDAMFAKMKRGTYLVNTARGRLIERDAVVRAMASGQLAGYAGDVWFPQPPPAEHPWRTMPFNGMTPHVSGSSLSAQARYAAGTLEILESYFGRTPIREEYLIVDGGALAGTGASSYKLT